MCLLYEKFLSLSFQCVYLCPCQLSPLARTLHIIGIERGALVGQATYQTLMFTSTPEGNSSFIRASMVLGVEL